MEGPFYRSYRSPSRYYYYSPQPEPTPAPFMREVPVQRPISTDSSKRRVISIPVHDAGSGREKRAASESESALKIQKAFRGYVVRKLVRKVVEIEKEVEEVGRRIANEEIVEKIVRDERERLKVNEALMNLLFKLDSVRGVDPAVRDLRRSVIRKAVALQEALDAIAASHTAEASDRDADVATSEDVMNDSTGVPASEKDVGDAASPESALAEEDRVAPNSSNPCADEATEMEDELGAEETREDVDSELKEPDGPDVALRTSDLALEQSNDVNLASETVDRMLKESNDAGVVLRISEPAPEQHNDVDVADADVANENVVSGPQESISDGGALGTSDSALEERKDVDVADANLSVDADVEDGNGTESQVDSSANPESMNQTREKADVDDNDVEFHQFETKRDEDVREQRSSELLERMVKENEKMMKKMIELFERNEKQTSLLNSLSQRVELLEKAYVCEKLRRMKKKRKASSNGLVGCLD